MDVHATSTVWCLLDGTGAVVARGRVATTTAGLAALLRELGGGADLVAGHEVGTMAYFVHDTLTAAGVRCLAFNAQHLRMIAASRKKTDRRDAYWIAKALQSGMYPPPVYIPTGEVRELRVLLHRRRQLQVEYGRWRARARAALRAAGSPAPRQAVGLRAALAQGMAAAAGSVPLLGETLALCQRQMAGLQLELQRVDQTLRARATEIEVVQRLRTVPAIGVLVALTIYAAVADVRRFPTAKALAAYAGLVATVRQSGETLVYGAITKQGAPALRRVLVQAAHVLLTRCARPSAQPLRAIGLRILTGRGRRKIAVVALARHLLRIAYYILRDGTTYDPTRLASMRPAA